MNLALAEVRSSPWRFLTTSIGIGFLFAVVLAMAGVYGGLVEEATILARSSGADLWVVERHSRGPFADTSHLDPSLVDRVAGVAGVGRARGFTYQIVQRSIEGRELRFALVGLDWPEDDGRAFPLVAGRPLRQARGELIADASLAIALGSDLSLAGEQFRIVGLTRKLVAPGGEPVVFASAVDAQLIAAYAVPDARVLERARRISRLLQTEVGTQAPMVEELLRDSSWIPPALANAPVNAVLANVVAGADSAAVRAHLSRWEDVSVLTQPEQERVLLDGVVDKPKRQLALFSVILTLTSSILIAALIYAMTLDKAHEIAVLKLLGAPTSRVAGMVLQQTWLMGALGYAVAVSIGRAAFPHFPRRIVLLSGTTELVGALVFVVTSLASLVAVVYVLRIDAARALEN